MLVPEGGDIVVGPAQSLIAQYGCLVPPRAPLSHQERPDSWDKQGPWVGKSDLTP